MRNTCFSRYCWNRGLLFYLSIFFLRICYDFGSLFLVCFYILFWFCFVGFECLEFGFLYSILGLGNNGGGGEGVGWGGGHFISFGNIVAYLVSYFCITGKLLCNIFFRLW